MAPPIRPETVIGLDVGKSSHWACVVTREGELLASRPIPNRENAIDGLYMQYPGALVVVDQVRNIGSLALSRARLAGMPRAYLPGLAAHGASKLFESTPIPLTLSTPPCRRGLPRANWPLRTRLGS